MLRRTLMAAILAASLLAVGCVEAGSPADERLAEGWERVVAIPHTAMGEGDRYVVRVEGGWLQVRRETKGGETVWRIVLAQASDPTPPIIDAPKGMIRFALSYRGGRYFVREDLYSLRSVRERKIADPWPAVPIATEGRTFKASAGDASRPPALELWKDDAWVLASAGPAAGKPDCLVRLSPVLPEIESVQRGGCGGIALNAGSSLTHVFYGEARLVDDGELLVAERTLRTLDTEGPKAGDPAPPFTVTSLGGRPLRLADYRGKFVLLDFWATWCGPCLAEVPRLKTVHAQYGKDPRFVMIGLSLDAEAAVPKAYVEKHGLAWEQGFLGTLDDHPDTATDYGVTEIPAILLIGPDGKVIARGLRGETVEAAVAKALGCR